MTVSKRTRIRLGADDLRIQMILLLLVIGISFIVAYVFLLLGITWGDDGADPAGCILPAFCNQMAEMTQRDITMRLEIWNNAGCSVRDICTPATAKCQEGDQDCLTSLPQRDYGPYNETHCYLTEETCPDVIAPEIQKGKH